MAKAPITAEYARQIANHILGFSGWSLTQDIACNLCHIIVFLFCFVLPFFFLINISQFIRDLKIKAGGRTLNSKKFLLS